jgi:Flp pilus assembly CpaF family ATPase
MLNPDGRLWVDRLSGGLADTGEYVSAADGERIVRLVAHHVSAEVHAGAPRVLAELPAGSRTPGLSMPRGPNLRSFIYVFVQTSQEAQFGWPAEMCARCASPRPNEMFSPGIS